MFARRGLSPSAYTRRVFEALADGDAAAAREMLNDLLAAIGLPPDAPREDVMAKLEELYDQIGDVNAVPADDGDPLAEAPDPEPVEPFATRGKVAKLSARELAECKRRGIDPNDFAARKAGAVKRTAPKAKPSKPVPAKLTAADRELCRRRGIDPAEFLRRKREAAKRL